MERWLEEKDNLEKWYDRLLVKERRILMIQQIGETWLQCCIDYYFFKRLFEKIGRLIIVDGFDDVNIFF